MKETANPFSPGTRSLTAPDSTSRATSTAQAPNTQRVGRLLRLNRGRSRSANRLQSLLQGGRPQNPHMMK